MLRRTYLVTAFLEGLSVLIVEIAGARALAPFFGTSLMVWTSQITATLLTLALGYALGGSLSRSDKPGTLPTALAAAGLWLAAFPLLRPALLGVFALAGVALGSFLAALWLFGPSLVCLGAVSPILIQRLERAGQGGLASGQVFFTNTLGGLLGGWLTALVLVPHLPLRLLILGTGFGLLLLAGAWWWAGKRLGLAAAGLLLATALAAAAPQPSSEFRIGEVDLKVRFAQTTSTGLLQVVDVKGPGREERHLFLNGATYGGLRLADGQSSFDYPYYLDYLAWRHHPRGRRALVVGLAGGALPRRLAERGLEVDAVDIEPAMADVARSWFGLPAGVRVHIGDGRDFLARSREQWDLIFLDTFLGENAVAHLMTVEALQTIRSRLAPGGRLLVNLLSRPAGGEGEARMESGLSAVFGEARAYIPGGGDGDTVNASLVAGRGLASSPLPYPGRLDAHLLARLQELEQRSWPCEQRVPPSTDELNDIDLADLPIRLQYRAGIIDNIAPEFLGD